MFLMPSISYRHPEKAEGTAAAVSKNAKLRHSISLSDHPGAGRDPYRGWAPAFAGVGENGGITEPIPTRISAATILDDGRRANFCQFSMA